MTTSRRARWARNRVWSALAIALGAVLFCGAVLLALEVTTASSKTAPTVTVSPGQAQTLTIDAADLALRPTHDITIRVHNDSASPATVNVTVSGQPGPYTVTLTASMTEQGAQVTSGPPSALALPTFTMQPSAMTPVTIQVDGDAGDLDALWASGATFTVTVAAAP